MGVRGAACRLLGRGRTSALAPADRARVHDLLFPDRCALLLVDVQNDFVHPRGRVGPGRARSQYAAAIATINSLIGAARTAGVPVIYVRTEHGPDVDSGAYRAVRARRRRGPGGTCLAGSWGAELAAELDGPRDGEQVVIKHGYDGFASSGLADSLAAGDRDTVVVGGVATTLCVSATVAGAFEHGLYAIVPREATAASDADQANLALRRIAQHYGDVVSASVVLEAWRAA